LEHPVLVVRVELWPYGVEDAKELLGDATIQNRGRDATGSSYRAVLRERPDPDLGIRRRDQTIHISGYNRRQSVWNLVLRMLAAAWFDHEVKSGPESARSMVEDTAADSEALALFLDVLPSAWRLTEGQVERLLYVKPGWLRAWRNYEVELDDAVRTRLWQLGLLQRRMSLISQPEDYSAFWHRAWADTSPLGNRSPWQAFDEEGENAIRKIQQFLDSGLQ
jgi:hypothetical protein